MTIFQALKRHPEISLIFLASFLAIFVLLDGPVLTYALSQTSIGKFFNSENNDAKNGVGNYSVPTKKLKPTVASTAKPKPKATPRYNPAYSQNLLTIPKLNISAPIVYSLSNTEEDIQKDLENGVAHFNGTVMPGQKGKSLVIGHSATPLNYKGKYGIVFTKLNDLVEGNEIYVYGNGRKLTYRVYKKEITEPILKGLDEQTDDSILILMTCWPPGTTWKRLFVYAKLVE